MSDLRRYNKIENDVRIEYGRSRSQFNVGVNSPDSTCNAKDYYLVVDGGMPSYNVDTHKYTGTTFTFDGTVDTKMYNIVALTQQEIDDTLATNIENGQNQCDASCSEYILSYWSGPAQSNCSMGLYAQDVCEMCKTEISAVLAENVDFIAHIATLTTKADIDTYVGSIVRTTITGAR